MLNDELTGHGTGSASDEGVSAYITQTFLGIAGLSTSYGIIETRVLTILFIDSVCYRVDTFVLRISLPTRFIVQKQELTAGEVNI